jgi:DnaK suppressor protein
MRVKKTLNKAELKKFKKIFEDKKCSIEKTLDKSSLNQGEVDIDGDEVDIIQGAILSDVANALSKRDLQTLNRLDIALEKIEKGIFGLCESCGELINEKRLLAILGCAICISCAEQDELDMKKFG